MAKGKLYISGYGTKNGYRQIDIPNNDLLLAIEKANKYFKKHPNSRVIVYSYEYSTGQQISDLWHSTFLPKGKIEHYIEPEI